MPSFGDYGVSFDESKSMGWIKLAGNSSDYTTAYGGRGYYYDALCDNATRFVSTASKQHQIIKEQADRHYTNNEYPKAIAAYTQAITLSLRYAALYYNRGISYHFSGMKQLAIADLQKAAQLYQEQGKERDYRDTLNQLAKVRH